MTPIDVFIFAINEQMKKLENKKSDIYLTLKACKELAEDIKKQSLEINSVSL